MLEISCRRSNVNLRASNIGGPRSHRCYKSNVILVQPLCRKGFLSISADDKTDDSCCGNSEKNSNIDAISQHTISDHYWPTTKTPPLARQQNASIGRQQTPLIWRFAGGPIVAHCRTIAGSLSRWRWILSSACWVILHSKKGGKYQESIQSSSIPDPGCHMGK